MLGVDPQPLVPPLEAIACLTVEAAADRSGWLELQFDHGARLRVSPDREVWTAEQRWWLTDWYTTPFW